MIRKQIYIGEAENAQLQRIARANGVSEAAVIREALQRRLGEEDERAAAWDQLKAELLSLPLLGEPKRFDRLEAYRDRLD